MVRQPQFGRQRCDADRWRLLFTDLLAFVGDPDKAAISAASDDIAAVKGRRAACRRPRPDAESTCSADTMSVRRRNLSLTLTISSTFNFACQLYTGLALVVRKGEFLML